MPNIFGIPLTIGGLICIFILVISWLDYAGFIEFRKSVLRLTKCALCGRTALKQKIVDDVVSTVTKVTAEDADGDESSSLTETEHKKDKETPVNPFHGLIFYEKAICDGCCKDLAELLPRRTRSKT